MKFSSPQTLLSIADIIGAKKVGTDDFPVLGLNEIHVVEKGDIVFVDHKKYYKKALESAASVILINKEVPCPKGKALLISNDPFNDVQKLIERFNPFQSSDNTISQSAKIDNSTIIQPGVFIGNNVKIGKNCLIHSNVSVYDNSIIGDNVIIHANSVIGSDAFYYQKRKGEFKQFKSCGRVLIKNDVHIGANCTIDRGVTGDTIVGDRTKIDNLVQIGHDTQIGKDCLFASQVGIAGCVIIKNNVTLWGQVGVSSDITINENVTVLAQSGVGNNLEKNKSYFGSPCEESRKKFREFYTIKKLVQEH